MSDHVKKFDWEFEIPQKKKKIIEDPQLSSTPQQQPIIEMEMHEPISPVVENVVEQVSVTHTIPAPAPAPAPANNLEQINSGQYSKIDVRISLQDYFAIHKNP